MLDRREQKEESAQYILLSSERFRYSSTKWQTMKDKIRVLKLIVVNYSVFLTLLVTVELVGQISYRIFKGRFLYETPPNVVFEDHPYLSGIPKKNFRYVNAKGLAVTTEQHGFRITRKNDYEENAINIICLGGSSTFGTRVGDEESWPYKLQENLGNGYNVFNMGVPGYTSLEAIIQLVTLVPELNPHVIIIYEGWNDIRNYHVKPRSPDYYWHGMSQKINLEFGNRTLWDNFFITKLAIHIGRVFHPVSGSSSNAEVFSSNDSYVDSIYVRNLRTIKSLCDNLKAKMIFIPQVLNLDSLSKATGSYAWTPHIENKQMPILMERFNSLMGKAIQTDQNTIVIENIQKKYQWSPEHFADFGHFNKSGGDLFSEIIKTELDDLEVHADAPGKSSRH